MSLFRNEFNQLLIRLGVIKNDLTNRGFTDTAEALSNAISLLGKVDNVYLLELTIKKGRQQDKSQ